MGKDKSAGASAGNVIQKFNQLGIDELRGFADAGQGQLESLISGASIGGLDERLAQIFSTDTFGSIQAERERGVQSQLAAGGLTRSGTGVSALADVGTNLGLQIEQLLTGRSQQLAGQGLQASGGIADLFSATGAGQASGILADAQTRAGVSGNIASGIGTAAGLFFSDPSLKTNVVKVSEIGNLAVHQWDWIKEVEGTPITAWGNTGFMADEIKEKYPHHIGDFHGLMTVDYFALLDELQDKYGIQHTDVGGTNGFHS